MTKPTPARHRSLMRSFSFCVREAVRLRRVVDKKKAALAAIYPDGVWGYQAWEWENYERQGWTMFWAAIHNLRAAVGRKLK